MTSRFQALIVSALLVWALPSPVAAQTPDPGAGQGTTGGQGTEGDEGSPLTRPFRGLFGLGDEDRTGLDLSGAIFGAYDENLGATLPARTIDPRYQRSGWYTGANSRLSYNWRGERASVNGWGTAASNYYPDFADPVVPSYTAGVGFSRPLGRRNTIRASQTAAYSPYFLSGFFPELPTLDELPVPPIVLDPGLTVSGNTVTRYSTSASVNRELSRQASVSLGYTYHLTDYSDTNRRYVQQRANIGFRRRLTRHASLRLGYGYRTATTKVDLLLDDGTLHREMHDLDLGIDYSRALSLSMSRRTKLSFSTGSTFLAGSDISAGDLSSRSRARFFVTGSAQLAHEMGRTWNLSVVYARRAGFSDLLFEPVTSDSVSALISGLIGRRNEVSLRALTSRGNVGASRAYNNYESYIASAQWRRALTRYLATQVSYLYYDHGFGQSVRLPLGFPQAMNRHGVKFGVNVWFPLH